MNLSIVVNGPPLLVDIIGRTLGPCSDTLPADACKHLLVVEEPSSVMENNILNYCVKHGTTLHYLGTVNPDRIDKLVKYTTIMVYDVKPDVLREIQRVAGSKVHWVENPAYFLTFEQRIRHLNYVYGMLKEDIITEDDYMELFDLSARVTVKLGLTVGTHCDKVQEYIMEKGIPVTVRIITTTAEYFKFFHEVDRVLQPECYKALGIAANIPDRDITEWGPYRKKTLAQAKIMSLDRIRLLISNGVDNHTDYYKAKSLDNEQLSQLSTQLEDVDPILALQVMMKEKYGCYRNINIDHVQHHRTKCKIETEYAPFKHLSQAGGVKVVHDLYSLFVEHYKANLFYASIPIDYPWIGIIDMTTTQLKQLWDSEWFQQSIPTCMGFITFTNKAKDMVTDLYQRISVKSHYDLIVDTMTFPIMCSWHQRTKGKLVYAIEPATNALCIFQRIYPSYEKYYYGFELPQLIHVNDDWDDSPAGQLKHHIMENYEQEFTFNCTEIQLSTSMNDIAKKAYWELYRYVNSCKPIDTISDAEVFITHLEDECLQSPIIDYCLYHHVPIIVNRCPLSIEYLGEDYPLYDIDMLTDELVQDTIDYLMHRKITRYTSLTFTSLYSTL